MTENTTPEPGLEPTDDETPDGTQIPEYHEATAEAGELAEREQGDAGVPDPEPFEED